MWTHIGFPRLEPKHFLAQFNVVWHDQLQLN